MPPKKSSTKIFASLCAEVHPRRWARPPGAGEGIARAEGRPQDAAALQPGRRHAGRCPRRPGGRRRLAQPLCHLRRARADASRLLVTVGALPGEGPDPVQVSPSQTAPRQHLRYEVAGAITRKRAPTLVYRYSVAAVATGSSRFRRTGEGASRRSLRLERGGRGCKAARPPVVPSSFVRPALAPSAVPGQDPSGERCRTT